MTSGLHLIWPLYSLFFDFEKLQDIEVHAHNGVLVPSGSRGTKRFILFEASNFCNVQSN